MTPRLLIRLLVIIGFCLLVGPRAEALSRPGGGHGYSGGSSHSSGSRSSSSSRSSSGSSSSSSGDDGALAELIVTLAVGAFRATRDYPIVMWPTWGLVAAVALLWLRAQAAAAAESDWTTTGGRTLDIAAPTLLPRVELETLREVDPDFSLVLFEDFVSALFARAHEARGRGRLEDLGAWLSPSAQRNLAEASRNLASVEGILVGSLRYVQVRGITPPNERIAVQIEIEANYTENYEPHPARARPAAFWVHERWFLSRARDARTPPPDRLRSFGCPTCGAPLTSRSPGKCAQCGRQIDPADFDWLVDTIHVRNRRPTPPALTGDTREAGTDLPTIVDPNAEARRQAIEARDPAVTWPAFEARVRHIFTELQPAWSTLDLERARPYLSDQLFRTWSFWIDAYRRQGLANISEQAEVVGVQLARVVSDRAFDAITVRLHASGLDYTVDTKGELQSGSRDTPRVYTEYWTLIRGSAAAGPPRLDTSCPNCGAPMAVNMAGDCEHCGSHVTAGEFDWVLSRVEQDDSYQG
jgi:hypothetical protein